LSLAIGSDDLYSNLGWVRSNLAVHDVLPVNLLTDVVHVSNLSVVGQLFGDCLSFTLAVNGECNDGNTSGVGAGGTGWLLGVTHLTCETLWRELA